MTTIKFCDESTPREVELVGRAKCIWSDLTENEFKEGETYNIYEQKLTIRYKDKYVAGQGFLEMGTYEQSVFFVFNEASGWYAGFEPGETVISAGDIKFMKL